MSRKQIDRTIVRDISPMHTAHSRVRTPPAVLNAPAYAPGVPYFPCPPGLTRPGARPHAPR